MTNKILIFIKNAVSNSMTNGAIIAKVKAIATAAKATFDLNEYSVFRRGCVFKTAEAASFNIVRTLVRQRHE